MTIHFAPVDLAVIVAYLATMIAVGLGFARHEKTSEGYFLAGRTLTMPAFVATLVATWYGGILGVGEYAYQHGLSMLTAFAFPYYVFALVFALFLAPRIRAAALYTIPDKLASVYGRPAGLVAGLMLWLMTNPAAYVLMLGQMLGLVFGWDLLPSLLAGVLLSTVYVYTGGFRADVRVNIAQFVLMFAGFAMLVGFCVAHGADWSRLPPEHLTLDGGEKHAKLVAWFLIALWTLVDPSFHQRCYAAKDPDTARRGVLVSIACWMVFDAMTVTCGLYAAVLLPGITAIDAYPLLGELLLPPVAKGFFFVAMLATVMSTLVSNAFIAGMTFARDLVQRCRGTDDNDRDVALWTGVGLLLTSLIAVFLAWKVQSVVSIWYYVGTTFVPGLLLPLLSTYVRGGAVAPALARWAMLLSSGTSLAWLCVGVAHAEGGWPVYPLGIEPMFPGLLVSGVLFAAGWVVRARAGAGVDEPIP